MNGTTSHPPYPPPTGDPSGDRCTCGGIRHWHAVAPHGCDDCDCPEFKPHCSHDWTWLGHEFACVTCSLRTTEPQALADLGEPTERTT